MVLLLLNDPFKQVLPAGHVATFGNSVAQCNVPIHNDAVVAILLVWEMSAYRLLARKISA